MVRVVGKEGALGAGVGGNGSSGMDGSKKIPKRYPGRVKCLLLWRISILGGAFQREEARKKKKKKHIYSYELFVIVWYIKNLIKTSTM